MRRFPLYLIVATPAAARKEPVPVRRFFVEAWGAGGMLGIAPVLDALAEVSERALYDVF